MSTKNTSRKDRGEILAALKKCVVELCVLQEWVDDPKHLKRVSKIISKSQSIILKNQHNEK